MVKSIDNESLNTHLNRLLKDVSEMQSSLHSRGIGLPKYTKDEFDTWCLGYYQGQIEGIKTALELLELNLDSPIARVLFKAKKTKTPPKTTTKKTARKPVKRVYRK